MITLGIDPGSHRVGYGVVSGNKNISLITYGVIEVRDKKPEQAILKIAQAITKLIKKHQPSVVGVEKIFFSKNVKTGISVAQTRGAILSEIAKANIVVKELSPSEIKLAVTGYGLADKKAVAKMVSHILKVEKIHGFDDASDALAIAITASTAPLD